MTQIISDENQIKEFLDSRYIEAVFPSKERAAEIMGSGKQLVFYLGIDPTGPEIHLGHTIPLLLLKQIAKLGHQIILLIGDFTARIGDPTDKEAARVALTEAEIKQNMKTYVEQVKKILGNTDFEVEYNSKWLSKMSFEDVIKLASRVTVKQMLARDMFRERLEKEKPIYVHEFLYPLMQGYDSVAMQVDGEVGGNDQTFNMLVGRDLEKEYLHKDKLVFTTRLLVDAETGKKISKTEGSFVAVDDSPGNIFGKIMAMSDSAIVPLFSHTTEVSNEKISEVKSRLEKGENPKVIKEELAYELVRMYRGEKEAIRAREEFMKVFVEGQLPEKIKEFKMGSGPTKLTESLKESGLASSMSEAKRLIEQKAVSVNDKVVESWDYEIKKGDVIKVGPRKFVRAI
jgi:tyrosyl-tRNA synthetase